MRHTDPAQLKTAAYAEAQAFELPADWQEGRQLIHGLTIDSFHTRDRDDAIWLKKRGDGGYNITTSIADVGSWMLDSPAVEDYAHYMGETRYLAAGNIPMIPPRISEGILSILDDKQKDGKIEPTPVISIHLDLDSTGATEGMHITRDSMLPQAITYGRVASITQGKARPEEVARMRQYESVAHTLLAQRQERGALAIYDKDKGYMTDDDGNVITFAEGSNRAGHLIVQEFMIITNAAVAAYMARHNIPALYRNHHFRENAPLDALPRILDRGEVNIDLLRQIYARARYSPRLEGHVGLNLPAYMHFTSPLRRFADWVNHANLVAHLEKRQYPYPEKTLFDVAAHINAVQDEVRASTREAGISQLRTTRASLGATALARTAPNPRRPHAANDPRNPKKNIEIGVILARGDPAEVLPTLSLSELSDILPQLLDHNGDHAAFRSAVNEYFAEHPHKLVSLLSNARAQQLLKYRNVLTRIDHERFSAAAEILTPRETYFTATGEALGSKAALQQAAYKVFAQALGVEAATNDMLIENYKTTLQDSLLRGGGSHITYDTRQEGGQNISVLQFRYNGNEYSFTGTATNKKGAEQQAARKALAEIGHPRPKQKQQPVTHHSGKKAPLEKKEKYVSPINRLQEYSWGIFGFADREHAPQYELVAHEEAGKYTCIVTVAMSDGTTREFTATEEGGKQKAKTAAAAAALAELTKPAESED